MSTLSEQIRSFTTAHDRSDRERVGANMNEQFVNETNEKPRILIVDNNSRFESGARLFLDRTGKYVVCSVIDPRGALESARNFKPDLVLVDLIMPQADGMEVAAQLEA